MTRQGHPDPPPPTRPTPPRYVLTLEAAPGSDVTLRLRCALKSLWRRHGLRCLSIRQVGPAGEVDQETPR